LSAVSKSAVFCAGGARFRLSHPAAPARTVRIGNSRGIRLPKALLEQAQLPEDVELLAEPGRIVVRPIRRRREGWAEAARAMHERGDDRLLDMPGATRFDREAWAWR
jgi:antitoxin MazE